MPGKLELKTFEDAVNYLREHAFDVLEAPGTSGRVFVKKYNVSAAIQKTEDGGVKIFAYPGYLVGTEISKLVNKGYQQFLLAGKEWMASGADFHVEVALMRRPGREAVAACAHHADLFVSWMDGSLHDY